MVEKQKTVLGRNRVQGKPTDSFCGRVFGTGSGTRIIWLCFNFGVASFGAKDAFNLSVAPKDGCFCNKVVALSKLGF